MRAITILFVLMITSVVQAQVLAVRTAEKQCDQNSCRQVFGTGTCSYIGNSGDRSVYITAAHVVENTQSVYVGYGGRWWTAVVAYQKNEGETDFAIIETRKIPAEKCYRLSGLFPEEGVSATSYGYSKGVNNLRALPSTIRIRNNLRGIRQSVDQGDSGGPIVVNGEVVGVISSVMHDDGMTVCTPSNLIRTEVKRRYSVFPSCACTPRKVVVQPIQPKPDPIFYQPIDNSGDLEALQGEVSKLRAQIDALAKTQIPVQIIGADGKMVTEQKYPLGDPIKLRFKAVKK